MYMLALPLIGPQKTPLFLACSNGHQVAAEVLMKEKADVTAQGYNKLNCLDVAVKNGHKYICSPLYTYNIVFAPRICGLFFCASVLL